MKLLKLLLIFFLCLEPGHAIRTLDLPNTSEQVIRERNTSQEEFLYPQCVQQFKLSALEELGIKPSEDGDTLLTLQGPRDYRLQSTDPLFLKNSCEIIGQMVLQDSPMLRQHLNNYSGELSSRLLVMAIEEMNYEKLSEELKQCQQDIDRNHCSLLDHIEAGYEIKKGNIRDVEGHQRIAHIAHKSGGFEYQEYCKGEVCESFKHNEIIPVDKTKLHEAAITIYFPVGKLE